MEGPQTVKIRVRVHPGGKRNEVLRYQEGIWHIRVMAHPVEGRANAELARCLAEPPGVSRSYVAIERGRSSRTKPAGIMGLATEQVESQLTISLSKGP